MEVEVRFRPERCDVVCQNLEIPIREEGWVLVDRLSNECARSSRIRNPTQLRNRKSIRLKYLCGDSQFGIQDLDNTVMMPPQTLGTDQWFDHLVQANLAQGYDSALAVTEAVRTWISVQKVTRMLPVERTTPSLIHQLQAEGYLVSALTARPPELHDVTVRQLASIGVRFQQVLSIGPTQSKGDAMKTFLATATSRISRVIFIDDKQKHVDTVNSSLNSLGGAILHTEYRYGATDNKVRAYNANVAECEWKIFEQTQTLVSDSACGGN